MEAFKIKNGISAKRYLGSNGTETAGSEGYALSNATYDSVSFSVSGQDTDPYGLFFKPDGTVMYVAGDAGNDINQYSLSSAWDISTASFVQNFSVSVQESAPSGVFFKPDGTKMYVVGTATDAVYQYSVSTAWDISTASYDSVSFNVGSQDTFPLDLSFKPDGTKMFVIGKTGDSVYEYDLSTAWVLSSASFSGSFSVASQETGPQGLFISPTGVDLFVVGAASASVNYYTLITPWEISTATHTGSFSVSAQEGDPQALYFKSDGTRMYILGSANDTIYQYSTALPTQTLDLSTGTTFSFTPSGATTVSFTNPPATGTAIGFSVEIIGDGSAITWPSSVKWHLATAPVALASKELYTFVTTDGGTTYYGKKAAEGLA